jgi:hypothetical protein
MNACGVGWHVPAWRRSSGGQHGDRGGAPARRAVPERLSAIEDPGRDWPESARQADLSEMDKTGWEAAFREAI